MGVMVGLRWTAFAHACVNVSLLTSVKTNADEADTLQLAGHGESVGPVEFTDPRTPGAADDADVGDVGDESLSPNGLTPTAVDSYQAMLMKERTTAQPTIP